MGSVCVTYTRMYGTCPRGMRKVGQGLYTFELRTDHLALFAFVVWQTRQLSCRRGKCRSRKNPRRALVTCASLVSPAYNLVSHRDDDNTYARRTPHHSHMSKSKGGGGEGCFTDG